MSPTSTKQVVLGSTQFRDLLLEAVHADMHLHLQTSVAAYNAAVEHITYRVDHPIPPLAVGYLHLMVNGLYRQAIPEWLVTVADMGYQPQVEVIYMILQAFTKSLIHSRWYETVQSIFGAAGSEMAQHLAALRHTTYPPSGMQHAKQHSSEMSPSARQQAMILATQEIEEAIRNRNPLPALSDIRWVWSPTLTNAFLKLMVHDTNSLQYTRNYLYYLSLEHNPAQFQLLLGRFDYSFSAETYQKILSVMTFRQQMVAAIKGELP